MPHVFEQPWLMLIVSLVVFLAVGTWRALVPEKNRWWQWCIPLGVALLGLGLDFVVPTDREQVIDQSKNLIVTVTQEDYAAIEALLAPDYQDAMHRDRAQLMAHVRSGLTRSPILKLTKISREIEALSASRATVHLPMVLVFEKESQVASIYKQQFFVTVRITLAKQADGRWLIQRLDLLEVDRQPFSWGQIPGQVW